MNVILMLAGRSDENIHVDDMEEILENQSQFENNITGMCTTIIIIN